MGQIRFSTFVLHQQIVRLLLSKKDYPQYCYVRYKIDKELHLFLPIVDLSQVLILLSIDEEPSGVVDVAPLVSTIRTMVQRFYVIGRFSSSMSQKRLANLAKIDWFRIFKECQDEVKFTSYLNMIEISNEIGF